MERIISRVKHDIAIQVLLLGLQSKEKEIQGKSNEKGEQQAYLLVQPDILREETYLSMKTPGMILYLCTYFFDSPTFFDLVPFWANTSYSQVNLTE